MANARAQARIEARIRERVAHCVEFELNDPRASFITVTGVEVSPDLSIAKILYSVYGSEGDKSKCARMLEDANGFVRRQVGRVLNTRRIPQLKWAYDDSVEFQANMEGKISDALDHDREVNPEAHGDAGPTATPDAEEEEDL
jgi:ribosome-binding factor A